ncbi:TPA: hypothetical protein DCZ39_03360 [Patescibacteria group bacterium]|nr:hypothetical protein [Candidatus Gracilibacteria bacterium]
MIAHPALVLKKLRRVLLQLHVHSLLWCTCSKPFVILGTSVGRVSGREAIWLYERNSLVKLESQPKVPGAIEVI